MRVTLVRWLGDARFTRACLALALVACGTLVIDLVLRMPLRTWSTARFAWGASLGYGYDLYYGPGSGPVLPSLYGPVAPLTRLPALLASGLTTRILVAGAINASIAILPVFWVLRRRPARAEHDAFAVNTSIAAALVALLTIPATMEIVGGLHVDAQAVGFGLLACACLMGREPPGWARLGAAAMLSVLAVWSKQLEAPVVVAEVVYVWAAFGRGVMARFVALLAGIGAAASLAVFGLFGPREVWFNLVTIPGSHPVGALGPLLTEVPVWAVPCVAIIAFLYFAGPSKGRRWLQQDWALPVLAALFLLPLTLMARAKVGGWVNSYHCLYYLVVAAALAVRAAPHALGVERARQWSSGLLVVLLAVMVPQALSYGAGRGLRELPRIGSHPEQQAIAFAREHPGEVYFPWNPLANLEATGELHHFGHALHDRRLAGFPVSEEHFRAHLPARLRWIVFPRGYPITYVLDYLPDFTHRTTLAELPGWVVCTRVPDSE